MVHQREKALQNLDAAFQKYKGILANFKEGTQVRDGSLYFC